MFGMQAMDRAIFLAFGKKKRGDFIQGLFRKTTDLMAEVGVATPFLKMPTERMSVYTESPETEDGHEGGPPVLDDTMLIFSAPSMSLTAMTTSIQRDIRLWKNGVGSSTLTL